MLSSLASGFPPTCSSSSTVIKKTFKELYNIASDLKILPQENNTSLGQRTLVPADSPRECPSKV